MQFECMNKTIQLFFGIALFISYNTNDLYAQVENADALPKQFDLLGQESIYWTPNLLQSNFAGLNELALYQGFAVNWIPRGLAQSKGNTINGIDWHSNLNGWDPSFSYSGLYGGIKSDAVVHAYGIGTYGLGGQSGNRFSSSKATQFAKSKSVSTRISNASSMQEFRIQWHSGRSKKSTWFNIEAIYQNTPRGYLANGMKDRKGLLLSFEKMITDKHHLGFSFWWSLAVQGKRTPTVQEIYDIAKDPLYNPSWGWKAGNAFYANTKKNNAPVLNFQYDYKANNGNTITLNLGGVIGTQSTTQLDWSKTADPRPDYYKYLPSFASDPLLKNKLLNVYVNHPDLLQIQFDQIVAENQSNLNGASKYIINQRQQNLALLRASFLSNVLIGKSSHWYSGLSINSDRIGYSNIVADLLGGKFYYNYNTWVNEDGLSTAFQNDIESPDRKIKQGEIWGAQYSLFNSSIHAWTALTGATRFLEWGAGLKMGIDQFRRKGLNQNGLYPTISKGLSEFAVFPSFQYQFYLRYKFNGRWYLTTHLFQAAEAPDAADLYTDPSNHAVQNSFLLPLIKFGSEFKLQFMGSNVKASLALFLQSNQNERQFKLFYHDYYNAFVRASLGQMKTIHQGIETYVETNWSSPIQLSIANSVGWYLIANEPLYEIRLSDNLYKVQSGKLLLSRFPANAYPQGVQAATINYQPSYSLRFSYTILYASKRAISHDLFRRSSWAKENTSIDNWENIQKPVYAPNQWVSNLFISKNFQIKTNSNSASTKLFSLRLTASIRNILNTVIPSLIFEQSRYDYKNFKADKFPEKYIYDLGRTYTIGLQLYSL